MKLILICFSPKMRIWYSDNYIKREWKNLCVLRDAKTKFWVQVDPPLMHLSVNTMKVYITSSIRKKQASTYKRPKSVRHLLIERVNEVSCLVAFKKASIIVCNCDHYRGLRVPWNHRLSKMKARPYCTYFYNCKSWHQTFLFHSHLPTRKRVKNCQKACIEIGQ